MAEMFFLWRIPYGEYRFRYGGYHVSYGEYQIPYGENRTSMANITSPYGGNYSGMAKIIRGGREGMAGIIRAERRCLLAYYGDACFFAQGSCFALDLSRNAPAIIKCKTSQPRGRERSTM
jgi:hypothetical protein